MDPLKRLEASIAQTRPIVAAAAAGDMAATTPCNEWDVRRVVNHVVGALVMFTDVAEKGSADPSVDGGDLIGTDPVAAYDKRSEAVLDAWSKPGRLEQPAGMPWGPMPADLALNMLADDVVVHGWDLARATGQQVQWDDALVEETYAFAKGFFADPAIRKGSFAEPVSVPDDAPPIERLVGFLGRNPA